MKKLKVKKLATTLFILLLVVGMCVGCEATPVTTSGGATSTPSPAESQTAPASTEPVTITFWHEYSESSGQITLLEDELIPAFEAANPGIKVNPVTLTWQQQKDSVVAGAASGMLPDILRGDIAFVPQFQNLNVLAEMSAFPDYADVAASVLEAPNSSAKMGDKYYGIASNTNTKILFYNKTVLEAAGITPPTTLTEMYNAAKALSNDKTIAMVEGWAGIWNFGPEIWSNGGEILSPDNSTANGYLNSATNVATIQQLVDLKNQGALAVLPADPGLSGDTDGWTAGKYVMEIDGPWRAGLCSTGNIDYGAVPMPAGSSGKGSSVLGGEDFMMFKTSDAAHQEAAWKFIKFMVGKEAQAAMAKAGQMPVNIEATTDSEVIAAMPLLPVFAEALKTAKARPVTAKWGDMENLINTELTNAFTGAKTVQQALDDAATAIDALIAE